MSNLSDAIKARRTLITAEMTPPCGPDPKTIKDLAAVLQGKVHAVVLEESPDGVCMNSVAAAAHLQASGAEPVVTLLTRDMNRIGLQSALLGAVSLGIENFLVLSGHHQTLTAEKQARGVYDVDSVQAIAMFRSLADNGQLIRGKEEKSTSSICIGGAANPFAGPIELRALRIKKKIAAGADFIVTNPVFDVARFREWVSLFEEKGVPESACLIAGVMWLQSADEARKLNETYRGMNIPESVIRRLDQADDSEREGLSIAAEAVDALKSADGVRGFHFWAKGREKSLPELFELTGLSVK
jgi:5,10-methylenetetrahydrofolate reductase